MDKQELRRKILAERRLLNAAQVETDSRKITALLEKWPVYLAAGTVMAYLAMPDEPQLDSVIESMLRQGKKVCAPRFGASFGIMYAAPLRSLCGVTKDRMGIRVPVATEAVPGEEIDLVLVPGVAFDLSGRRLGMGAGYYDRFLAAVPNAVLVGIAWWFQIMQTVPCERHDVCMHWLITENGIYDCTQGKV
ncbi:MAG: 5-formyltetrahydrofolate cyclo-ligase [Negativicutes bacterium]|nr:5-formyltetrahydrofolate cyclo-ligase [Negativicutes bacterium]